MSLRKSILEAAYNSVKDDIRICGMVRNKYAIKERQKRVDRWRDIVKREKNRIKREDPEYRDRASRLLSIYSMFADMGMSSLLKF